MNQQINLHEHEDGSVPSMNLGRSIDMLPEDQKNNFINISCQKLAFGGRIIIQGLHLNSFAKLVVFGGQADIGLILGLQSITDINNLKNTLAQNGLNIEAISVNNGIYTIEAVK